MKRRANRVDAAIINEFTARRLVPSASVHLGSGSALIDKPENPNN